MDSINWLRILVDLIVLLFLLIIFAVLKYVVTPFYSGFYCDDFSVNMPYKPSTVTNSMLIVLATMLPLVIILSTELIRTLFMRMKGNGSLSLHNKYKIRYYSGRIVEVPEQLGNFAINYTTYLFGLLCNLILTLIGKQTIGRLRPNFLDVCKPSENVYKDYCSKNTYLIPLESFKCTNPNQHDIDESRKSFPSGHSSTIFYTCLFLILFIHKTWTRRNLGFFPQFAQFLLLCLAFFTALSRVVDNKHHPTDVLAGSVLGIVNALFTFFYLKMFFKRYNYRNKYDSVGSGGGGVGGHTEIKMLDVDLESNAPTLKSDLHGKKSKNSYCTKTI